MPEHGSHLLAGSTTRSLFSAPPSLLQMVKSFANIRTVQRIKEKYSEFLQEQVSVWGSRLGGKGTGRAKEGRGLQVRKEEHWSAGCCRSGRRGTGRAQGRPGVGKEQGLGVRSERH